MPGVYRPQADTALLRSAFHHANLPRAAPSSTSAPAPASWP
ncbi:hypothetical protein ACFQV2_26790 [Actinokineospora soli]|uniref:Uncharacterized protein n=1 Tax=Actinokineospora soli TaxID=1048753 RepID=A0ABW2TU74_9PSEU